MRLSLAPGTTGLRAMSASAAVATAESAVPAAISPRRRVAAPTATIAGAPTAALKAQAEAARARLQAVGAQLQSRVDEFVAALEALLDLGASSTVEDVEDAVRDALDVIAAHADKVDGVKISLLDAEKEVAMRRRLPPKVRMYTGDDFNYPELIAGDDQHHSDALLGIFDPIAPAVGGALAALAKNDISEFHEILAPTVPLSRHVFRAPTRFYKTGVVFLAWLNGHQDHFTMVGGQQSARSISHFAELFRLADAAGLLSDPDRAASRMRALLAVHGVEA